MAAKKHTERPCCGSVSAQRTRLTKLDALIKELSVDDSGEYAKRLQRALDGKNKIEGWLAAHPHPPRKQ